MASRRRARSTIRRARVRRRRAAGLLLLIAIAAATGYLLPAPSSWTAPASSTEARGDASGEAGGDVPDGATVFDDETPGVVNLDPALLGALRQAGTDAAYDGVEFFVTSGWRSPAYQERLLHQAVSEYGSEEEAARWVAAPDVSPHVAGDAVDIGSDGATWLSEHGAAYGLCQIYGNEPWHYELRPEASDYGCPPTYPDPTSDPRMHQTTTERNDE
jgi:hypothetical protein